MHRAPLEGIRIVEVGGVGPGPYGVLLLADLGAEVIRVDRAVGTDELEGIQDGVLRNRRSLRLDFASEEGLDLLLRLIDRADVLVEAFRPGVAERRGFGPEVCLARHPGLVYARMTGWGQDGPLRDRAGHDINYAALSGAVHPIGPADGPPAMPLNYLADFGGGGTFLVMGVLGALLARERHGAGQVVDVAMVDGTASLTTFLHGMHRSGWWSGRRGDHLNDGSRPFYNVYATADEGGFIAVGCIEAAFYAEFLDRLGLDPRQWPQHDAARWPEQRAQLADLFGSRDRAHWEAVFEDSDACVSPVLRPSEAPEHPHLRARATFVAAPDGPLPAAAPRFSGHTAAGRGPVRRRGEDTDEILRELGLDEVAIDRLRRQHVVA